MTSPEGSMAAPKQGGLFEDLIEVLYAPSKVFDRSRAASAFKYAAVLFVLVLVLMIATKNLLTPWFDAQTELTIKLAAAKGKPIPDNAAASMRSFTPWSIVVGGALTMLIGPYLNAIWLLIGAKIAKAPLTYSQAALVAVLAGVPRLLGWLAMPIQAILSDGANARSLSDLSLGPARFVDPNTMPPAVLAALGNLDVFRLWHMALIVIGVSVVSRVSKGTAAVAMIILFAISLALQLIPSALFG